MLSIEAMCLIRISLFLAPNKLAHEKCVNLTIPILASIYRGLNRITMARNLNKLDAIFLSNCVYGWLRTYFKTILTIPIIDTTMPKWSATHVKR